MRYSHRRSLGYDTAAHTAKGSRWRAAQQRSSKSGEPPPVAHRLSMRSPTVCVSVNARTRVCVAQLLKKCENNVKKIAVVGNTGKLSQQERVGHAHSTHALSQLWAMQWA